MAKVYLGFFMIVASGMIGLAFGAVPDSDLTSFGVGVVCGSLGVAGSILFIRFGPS